jgi:hypothetical protein
MYRDGKKPIKRSHSVHQHDLLNVADDKIPSEKKVMSVEDETKNRPKQVHLRYQKIMLTHRCGMEKKVTPPYTHNILRNPNPEHNNTIPTSRNF